MNTENESIRPLKLAVEYVQTSVLRPYERNARTHSRQQVAQLVAAIREFGWTAPILIDEHNGVIAGHGRLLAAIEMVMVEVPCIRLVGMSDAQRRAYILADNQLASLAEWDEETLKLEVADLYASGFELSAAGFDDHALATMLGLDKPAKGNEDSDDGEAEGGDDDDAEPSASPVTLRGMIWQLGRHRIMCGDCTMQKHVDQLINGASIDCILTDPPYCSGGFQEAGKRTGSIGSEAIQKGARFEGGIANDKLSTRGFINLIRDCLGCVEAKCLYSFTDWRMWTSLEEACEGGGYAKRAMIVWDKSNPGMGQGWRAQHELCFFGMRTSFKFDGHKSRGNVIQSKRSGNEFHPTQKPLDLIVALIEPLGDNISTIYDPFGGSGTTLLAAEETDKTAFLMELSPGFVDTMIKRWQKATGGVAINQEGDSFDELIARRDGEAEF
jgi:DNA modification methylase